MALGDTLQGFQRSQHHLMEATEEQTARRIASTTAPFTVFDTTETHELGTAAGTAPSVGGDACSSDEHNLREAAQSGRHGPPVCLVPEVAHAHMPNEGDSDGDSCEESDAYRSMTLEVDSNDSGTDSTLGGFLPSSMASTRSSDYDAVKENGRTYHMYKHGTYYLPNDEGNLQHYLFYETFNGKLNLAPVRNPENVLDIGTGTGIWAMEFATRNPSALVIGSDLSAIQPHYTPPNCRFEIEDAEDVWAYYRKFDYIHGRALFSCFKEPPIVFKKAYDNLTPGGYFEMQDVYFKPHSDDGTVDGTAFARWNEMVVEGAKKLNRDWHCVQHYKRWFEEIGFQDVVERRFYWPMNPWAKSERMKKRGFWSMQNALEGANSISMAIMTRVLGRSPEEVEFEMEEVKRNIRDSSIHSYWPVYVVYGRKPL